MSTSTDSEIAELSRLVEANAENIQKIADAHAVELDSSRFSKAWNDTLGLNDPESTTDDDTPIALADRMRENQRNLALLAAEADGLDGAPGRMSKYDDAWADTLGV